MWASSPPIQTTRGHTGIGVDALAPTRAYRSKATLATLAVQNVSGNQPGSDAYPSFTKWYSELWKCQSCLRELQNARRHHWMVDKISYCTLANTSQDLHILHIQVMPSPSSSRQPIVVSYMHMLNHLDIIPRLSTTWQFGRWMNTGSIKSNHKAKQDARVKIANLADKAAGRVYISVTYILYSGARTWLWRPTR